MMTAMLPLALTLTLTAAPSVFRIDMQDALRLPSGVETPPARPIVIWLRAPAAWANQGALSEAGKTAVLAQLYGGPQWMKGNSDGSTYVVKRFSSKVLGANEQPVDGPQTWWYEVKADGTLAKTGRDFGPQLAPKAPGPLTPDPGTLFKQGVALKDRAAALEWLGKQQGLVKLAVTLTRGAVGFESRGAKAGAVELRCDDTRLGVALADRARSACGDAPTCDLWLIGRWKAGKEAVLEVTRVEGALSATDRQLEGFADHAWYEVK